MEDLEQMSDHGLQSRYQIAWAMAFGYKVDYAERDRLMELYGAELVRRGYRLGDLHHR